MRTTGLALFIGLIARWAMAAPPAPPSDLRAADVPNDAGTALKLTWRLSPDDVPPPATPVITGYRLERETDAGPAKVIATLPPQTAVFIDQSCQPNRRYVYSLTAVADDDDVSDSIRSAPATPAVSWFKTDGKSLLLFFATVLLCGGMVVSTELARRGRPVYIRPIAGLMAIEEAVGRATEMGRPMIYVPGIMDLNEIQTVAGITVLSHVAKTAAQYDMPLDVPTSRSLVMTAARDSVQAGCLTAGRSEVYDPNRVYYVTDDQFSYVAHVCGRMLREKPAACFYIGQFFAESLLLAETGNSVGAIQVAGTAEAAQMPFFVAACDYTLLGEEMFAASAYLSREPEELGMLRGQDLAKLLAAVVILGGCAYLTNLTIWRELVPKLIGA
jgi:hypothetical protein